MDDDLLQKKEPQLPRRPSFKIKCVKWRIALLYKSILLAWQCAVGLKITFKLQAHVTKDVWSLIKFGTEAWKCDVIIIGSATSTMINNGLELSMVIEKKVASRKTLMAKKLWYIADPFPEPSWTKVYNYSNAGDGFNLP